MILKPGEKINIVPFEFDENMKRIIETNERICRMNEKLVTAMCSRPVIVTKQEDE